MMEQIRDLRADEVECRVSIVKDNGLSILLYKDARCDMRILDETFGAENWQRDHFEVKGNVYCKIGVNRNYKTPEAEPIWVWKADCGAESYTEKEKGEASDSFKRAGFNWGIGRELYTAPFIWIEKGQYKERNGKPADKFIVTDMMVADKKIGQLTIKAESSNKVVYTYVREGAWERKCKVYLDVLKSLTNRDADDLYNEAVKMAKSTNYQQICYALATMLRSANNG